MDFKKTLGLIKGMLLEPRATWVAYAAENRDWQYTALVLTVPLVVVCAVAAWILGMLFSGLYMFRFGSATLLGMLLSIVFSLIGIALFALIVGIFAGVFKGNNNFSRAFACVSLAVVPSQIGQVFGAVPWVGRLIALAAGIWSLVLLYQMVPAYLAVPDDKRPGHYIVSLVVCIAIVAVFGAMFRRYMWA